LKPIRPGAPTRFIGFAPALAHEFCSGAQYAQRAAGVLRWIAEECGEQ